MSATIVGCVRKQRAFVRVTVAMPVVMVLVEPQEVQRESRVSRVIVVLLRPHRPVAPVVHRVRVKASVPVPPTLRALVTMVIHRVIVRFVRVRMDVPGGMNRLLQMLRMHWQSVPIKVCAIDRTANVRAWVVLQEIPANVWCVHRPVKIPCPVLGKEDV